MTDYPKLIITKLDTGFLLTMDKEQHAITSHDKMISKVGELFNTRSKYTIASPDEISETKTPIETTANTNHVKTDSVLANVPTKINKSDIPPAANNQRYGILESLDDNSKWPIKKSDFIVPELISIPTNENVRFAETEDSRLLIEYKSGRNVGRVYTTWDEINTMLFKSKPGSELLQVKSGDFASGQRTAIRQFMIGVRAGLKKGDSVGLDPDRDFRPLLKQSSVIEGERGTLEAVCAD